MRRHQKHAEEGQQQTSPYGIGVRGMAALTGAGLAGAGGHAVGERAGRAAGATADTVKSVVGDLKAQRDPRKGQSGRDFIGKVRSFAEEHFDDDFKPSKLAPSLADKGGRYGRYAAVPAAMLGLAGGLALTKNASTRGEAMRNPLIHQILLEHYGQEKLAEEEQRSVAVPLAVGALSGLLGAKAGLHVGREALAPAGRRFGRALQDHVTTEAKKMPLRKKMKALWNAGPSGAYDLYKTHRDLPNMGERDGRLLGGRLGQTAGAVGGALLGARVADRQMNKKAFLVEGLVGAHAADKDRRWEGAGKGILGGYAAAIPATMAGAMGGAVVGRALGMKRPEDLALVAQLGSLVVGAPAAVVGAHYAGRTARTPEGEKKAFDAGTLLGGGAGVALGLAAASKSRSRRAELMTQASRARKMEKAVPFYSMFGKSSTALQSNADYEGQKILQLPAAGLATGGLFGGALLDKKAAERIDFYRQAGYSPVDAVHAAMMSKEANGIFNTIAARAKGLALAAVKKGTPAAGQALAYSGGDDLIQGGFAAGAESLGRRMVAATGHPLAQKHLPTFSPAIARAGQMLQKNAPVVGYLGSKLAV